MTKKIGSAILCAAISGLFVQVALAQATSSPDYKAGYEAGYKAALEALKAGAASAATPPSTPAGAAAVAVSAPAPAAAEPRDWWNHSALMYDNLVPAWRHHLEVQFSATGVSGNDSGHALRGSGQLFSRSNRWTNELVTSLDKRHIVQSGTPNQRDYKMLQESLRYDLTKKLYGAGGFILERDDVNYIDRRNTLLAGLGYYVLDNPSLRLNTFIGLGRLDETYLAPVPSLIGISGRNSNILYLYQSLDWQLAKDWSLQQGFRQIRDLDESGRYVAATSGPTAYTAAEMVKRYRNVSSVALNYQLSPRSALSFSVESRYDSNPWPDVKSRDTTRRLSVRLMY